MSYFQKWVPLSSTAIWFLFGRKIFPMLLFLIISIEDSAKNKRMFFKFFRLKKMKETGQIHRIWSHYTLSPATVRENPGIR